MVLAKKKDHSLCGAVGMAWLGCLIPGRKRANLTAASVCTCLPQSDPLHTCGGPCTRVDLKGQQECELNVSA